MAAAAGKGGATPDHDLKIVMVGSIGVGKTSLVCRFVKDTFRDFLTTTIGASYMYKTETIDGQLVKYSLWDTAGQEQFMSLVPLYFRDADGVVMVVDGAQPQSVQSDVRLWLEKVRTSAPSTVTVMLAANKCDMQGSDEAVAHAEAMAKENKFLVAGVSAKTGEGVHAMYKTLAEACIEKRNSGGGRDRKQSVRPDGTVDSDSDDDLGGRSGTAHRTNSNVKKFTLKPPPKRGSGGGAPPEKKCKC